MGHRKYSAPRRGSMAYRPRARARSLESRVRTWPNHSSEKPMLRGFAGFKVSNLGVLTIDDREKTPNFGKNLLNHSTLIALCLQLELLVSGVITKILMEHEQFLIILLGIWIKI